MTIYFANGESWIIIHSPEELEKLKKLNAPGSEALNDGTSAVSLVDKIFIDDSLSVDQWLYKILLSCVEGNHKKIIKVTWE